MEFTLKEKLMLAIKFRKHKQNSNTFNEFNGETLVILPEMILHLKWHNFFYIKLMIQSVFF